MQHVATFNEANVVANCGWVLGDFPPGKFDHVDQAGEVLGNMYKAHALAYDAIKSQPGTEEQSCVFDHASMEEPSIVCIGAEHVQVGLVDSYMRWSALPGSGAQTEQVAAAHDHMWGNDLTRTFLQSGEFAWCVVPFFSCSVFLNSFLPARECPQVSRGWLQPPLDAFNRAPAPC